MLCQPLGCGVTRSKRRAMQWRRTAAETGHAEACYGLAARMYGDQPYAREVGHVGEAAGVAGTAGVVEGHDLPPDVLTSVEFGCRRGDIIQSTCSAGYAEKCWRGACIAATTGVRLWAF
jgi:TPR repeat protein